jgi:hypothetical protein
MTHCLVDLKQFYSNSEQDIKYPQRVHTILQRSETSRFPHTGQNWFGISSRISQLADVELGSLMISATTFKQPP